MLSEVRNSGWRTFSQHYPILGKIATKFEWLYLCFGVQELNGANAYTTRYDPKH
jgi:hypothetical protein